MKKIVLLLSIFALCLQLTPTHAASSVKVAIAIENLSDELYESQIRRIDYIGVSNGLPYLGGSSTCENFEDQNCKDAVVGILAETVLPTCESQEKLDCVESLRVTLVGESEAVAKFEGTLEGKVFNENIDKNISSGSTSSIFSVLDKNKNLQYFLVTVQLNQLIAKKSIGGFSSTQNPYFSASIKRVVLNSKSNCLGIFRSSCISVAKSDESTFSLTVNLKNYPPKWLAGRLEKPSVKISNIDQGVKVRITGTSVQVPVVKGLVPVDLFANYPRGFSASMVQSAADRGTELVIDSGLALMYAADVFDALNEKSAEVKSYWNVNGSSQFTAFCSDELKVDCLQGGNGPCVERSSEFSGVLGTNALAFKRNPPNLMNDEMQFLLASPHYMPDSKLTTGSFSIESSSRMLRCVYGLPDLPLFAEISVVTDGAIQKTATKSFSEKNGISRINVNNFTFSTPVIKVKLSQVAPKLSITCLKGKAKKLVTAVKPKCPAGYKKVS
jgi:hypothetical protein